MIPDHFYMSELGFIIYLGFYLPVVLIVIWLLWRKTKVLRWPVIVPLGLMLITLPFWDVYKTSLDASRLCKEQAGLHVYKTAAANSFRGGGNIVKLSKYGFTYAESYGLGGNIYRREAINGTLDKKVISAFSTRYEVGGHGYQVVTNNIGSNAIQTVDLQTGEVLGELVVFGIYPGWFDSLTLGWAGTISWGCGNEIPEGRTEPLSFDDLILATLKPKGIEGDAK